MCADRFDGDDHGVEWEPAVQLKRGLEGRCLLDLVLPATAHCAAVAAEPTQT